MPSNDELMRAADFITLIIDDPKYSEGAKYIATVALPLAAYVKSTLATEQAGERFDHFEYVCEHLPEDWRIDIRLEQGCADVLLFDPNGEHVDEPFEGEEPDIESMVRVRVDYAREKDGLTALGIGTTTTE